MEIDYQYVVDTSRITHQYTVVNNYITCEDVTVGRSILVRYLPDHPERSIITDASILRSPFEDYAALLAICYNGIFWTYRLTTVRRRFKRNRQATRGFPLLQKQGVMLDGEIENAYLKNTSKGYFLSVLYQFRTPEHKVLRGEISARVKDEKASLPLPGTPVTVLYADDQAFVML